LDKNEVRIEPVESIVDSITVYFANSFSIVQRGQHFLLTIGYDHPDGVSVKYRTFALDADGLERLVDAINSLFPEEKEQEETSEKKASSSSKKVCPNCGWENEPSAKFCVKCGAKLP